MRLAVTGSAIVIVALIGACGAGPAATDRPPSPSSPPAPSTGSSPRPSSSPNAPASSEAAGSPAVHVAIVLEAPGHTEAAITGGDLSLEPTHGGAASCRSVPDGTVVSDVTALDLGELGSGTLRAMWSVPGRTGAGAAELFIDAGDLADGAFQPFWAGPVHVTARAGDGASGTMTFTGLELETDMMSKPGQPGPANAAAWPPTISGSLSWACEPWVVPAPSSAP